MNPTLQVTHARLDDLPLVFGMLMQMDVQGIYDSEIGDHGLHTGLSGGWMMVVWLAYILTQSDHTKYKVEEWVRRHEEVIGKITGQAINAGQFSDNRLGSLLTRLSGEARWERFEATLWSHEVEVYEICPIGIGGLLSAHVDSTTVSGYGLSKGGPSRSHGHFQISGLTHLLTLAARAESLLEWEVERGLLREEKKIKGLYAGQPQQATATPTAVVLLKAIARAEITLTHVTVDGKTFCRLSPLPELLLDILRYLHLPVTLYTDWHPDWHPAPTVDNSVFDPSFSRK